MMTTTVLKNILVGTGGSAMMAFFLFFVVSYEKTLTLTPYILAFNGALVGYRLVDSIREKLPSLRLYFVSAVSSIAVGLLIWVFIHFSARYFLGYSHLTQADTVLYIVVSGFMSYLGAKLAFRYFSL